MVATGNSDQHYMVAAVYNEHSGVGVGTQRCKNTTMNNGVNTAVLEHNGVGTLLAAVLQLQAWY